MPKTIESDYSDEVQLQIAAWQRKAGLRSVYENWYRSIVNQLSPHRPVVEIGSGCGNFKRYFPEAIATDVFRTGQWIDEIVDARELPYQRETVGNFVLIDCLHHLPRPIKFLSQAVGALMPGGRILLLEPAITAWSQVVWKWFHHEPVDLTVDLFDDWDSPEPDNPGFCYANMATAHLLFQRDAGRLCELLPPCKIDKLILSDAFLYPATGGFSYFSLLPSPIIAAMHPWELKLMPNWLAQLTALRMLVVIEKR